MRIVYIDDFFHPDAGYHSNLLSKYWALFGNEVAIFTAEAEKTPESLKSFFDYSDIEKKDKDFEQKNQVRIIRCPIWKVISGRAVYKREIFKRIDEYCPDIVYCNGNDSLIGMQLTYCNKHAKYGLVLDSHMLEIASDNRFRKLYRKFYRFVLTPIIIKQQIPVIRTQDDDYIEKCLGIPLRTSPLISFGSDTLNFHPDEKNREKFRLENNISKNAFVVVYAGKLNKAKGLDLLKELLKKKINTKRELVFLIVGTLDSTIQNPEEYFDGCENRIVRYPTQKYMDLPKFYQVADIAIFPRQCSLSFFDVQACALPVVFEDNPLNRKRSVANNAVVFEQDNVEDLRRKVAFFANMDECGFDQYKKRAFAFIKEKYDYKDKALEYITILETQLKKKKNM